MMIIGCAFLLATQIAICVSRMIWCVERSGNVGLAQDVWDGLGVQKPAGDDAVEECVEDWRDAYRAIGRE